MPDASADRTSLLAFYLPQFHPIAENDAWWGKGFTEWANVVRALPRFKGHYQPRLPGDLGFYDLRIPEVREAQTELARAAGISGFVYYHYWFEGHRLLERPLDEVRATGHPDFPFALCWANETWSRRWDGSDDETLIKQTYSPQDDRHHITFLLDVMEDTRYITVDGRPLLVVYRPDHLPDARRTTDLWRSVAMERGRQLFLCGVDATGELDPSAIGFDATVEFLPYARLLGRRHHSRSLERMYRRIVVPNSPLRVNRVSSYQQLMANALAKMPPPHDHFRCIVPSWDNSPRRPRGARIVTGSTPDLYERWLTELLRRQPRDPLMFVNAWNEWAEGAYLEPDARFGHGYLRATRNALASTDQLPAALWPSLAHATDAGSTEGPRRQPRTGTR